MLDEHLLCINQATLLEQWSLPQFIDGMVRHRIPAISVWRDKLKACDRTEIARKISDNGLVVTSLCSGGFLTSADPAAAQAALDEARRAIDDAAAIGAQCLMLVAGGVDPNAKDVAAARARVLEGLAQLVPHARGVRMRLALEPLHPMVCATRSVLSTLRLANDWCDALAADDVFGIAVDTYAVWWDPELAAQIARAGRRICAFHINDWLAETRDVRLDRGMMGDGLIDIPAIRRLVEAAGYQGHREVEIFSERNWWRRDPDEVVQVIKERYQTTV